MDIEVNVVAARDLVGIAYIRLTLKPSKGFCRSLVIEVCVNRFSIFVLAIIHTALDTIPVITTQTADDDNGVTAPLTGTVQNLHKQGLDLVGIPITISAAAFAAHLFLVKEFDLIPEVSCRRDNDHALNVRKGFLRKKGFKAGILSTRTEEAVIFDTQFSLESNSSLFGLPTPNSIDLRFLEATKEAKELLFLFGGKTHTSTSVVILIPQTRQHK
jgi:hypothetical protein